MCMTATRFRVQARLTQHLGLPQPMKLHPVHHLNRVAYQFIEGGTCFLFQLGIAPPTVIVTVTCPLVAIRNVTLNCRVIEPFTQEVCEPEEGCCPELPFPKLFPPCWKKPPLSDGDVEGEFNDGATWLLD